MKKVFSSAMQCAHIWAQQVQDEGRAGNVSFRGPVWYSYSTPIAWIHPTQDRGYITLISSQGFSSATSGHKADARRASPNGPCINVPFIGEIGEESFQYNVCGWGRAARPVGGETWHTANLAWFQSEYGAQIAKFRRMRDVYSFDWLRHIVREANAYCDAFGLARLVLDAEADIAALEVFRAAREARLNTPEAEAKRDADRAKRKDRAERKAAIEAQQRREADADRLTAWITGNPLVRSLHGLQAPGGGVYLRVKGEELQTSQGASVPLAHAVRAFRFIKLIRARGDGWDANGHTVHVGHFTINRINSDGSFQAGCHFIGWPEIERIATLVGVLDSAPSDEAVEVTSNH